MKLNNYILNSDYTSQKQKYTYTINLSVNFNVGAEDMGQRYADITVPAGSYFETTLIMTSLTDYKKYVGNSFLYETSDMMLDIGLNVGRINNTTYRLIATVRNWDETSRHVNFTATAKLHLSIAPTFTYY